MGMYDDLQQNGPPPHTWGQLDTTPRAVHCMRSTPTYVGTIQTTLPTTMTSSVHPHIRGNNAIDMSSMRPGSGPPPHTWGQRGHDGHQAAAGRSTPTYVGTTPSPTPCPAQRTVHPHISGDNVSWTAFVVVLSGPPPHTWGQPGSLHPLRLPRRSTPTYVGTTRCGVRPPGTLPVHPHIRGDNLSNGAQRSNYVGPPPHTWGQRAAGCAHREPFRSTPTYVGTT